MSSRRYRSSQFISPYDLPQVQAPPFVDDFEEQHTMPVPTVNGEKCQEGVPPSAFFEWTQQETQLPEPYRPFSKLKAYDFDAYSHHRVEEHTMLSTMALKSIPSQQDQPESIMKSEISGAASNAAVIGFGNILGYIFKYSNNLLIQRALAAEGFGLYTLSMSVVTLIASIFDLGLDNAMIRYIAIYRARKQPHLIRSLTIFCTAIAGLTGLLGALIVFYLAPSLSTFMHKSDMTSLLQMMAPLIPLLCMQTVWIGGLQGFKEFKRRVLVQRFLAPMVMILVMVVMLLFYRSVMGVALVTLVSTLFSSMINLYFLFRKVSDTAAPAPEEYKLREWLGYSTVNFLSSIIGVILDAIDTLLLGFFALPKAMIGQYAAASKISGFIGVPLYSFNTMFAPTIAELHSRGEKQKLEAMFKLVTKWSIALSLPIFGIATLFSVPVLSISGSSFVAAWPLLIVLSIGNLINVGTGSVGFMLLMTGHQKYTLLNSFSAVVVNAVLGVILTPRYGAMGTAISTGLAICVLNLVSLLQVRLLLKMHPYRWDTLKPIMAWVISALLTGSLLYLLSLSNLSIRLFHIQLSIELCLVPVFLASYIGLLALFKISPEDRIVLDKLRTKFGTGKKRG